MLKKDKIAYSYKQGTNDKNIVFIHGSGCNGSIFESLSDCLPEYGRYLIDLPGHGKSEDTGFSIENYIESVKVFITGITNVILVGHSLGGSVALGVGSLNLDNVIGVVSISGGATFHKMDKDFLSKIHKGKVDKMYMLKESGNIFNLDVIRALTKMENDSVTIKDFIIDESLDIRDCLKTIGVKTVAITGFEDKVGLVEYSKLIHEEVTNSELIVINGYKHMLPIAGKNIVASHIRERF